MTTFTAADLQRHLNTEQKSSLGGHYMMKARAPRIKCADGYAVSVQASETHYCEPRTNDGPYDAVEMGFPTAQDDELMEYCEDSDNPTGTVYARVPVDTVVLVINKHGGLLDSEKQLAENLSSN